MSQIHEHLVVSSAPHINRAADTANIMRDVCIALIPSLCVSIYVYGIKALQLTAVCVAGCVIFEWAIRRILGRTQTIQDWSAAVTGMILSFNLPVDIPYWMALIGCFVSIVIVKQLFGGIGQNFANPALVGRIVLFVGFATSMNTWIVTPKMSSVIIGAAGGLDAVTGPTPLALFANSKPVPSNLEMFLGLTNGSMGEASSAALLLGGAYLIFRKVIEPTIPVCYIGTVFIMALTMGFDPIFHVCAGGVMLGAIFMATDYTTSPITRTGKIIYGIGCGILTMTIRIYAAYPEGVSFSILLMNILTPHIDSITRPRLNGIGKEGRE